MRWTADDRSDDSWVEYDGELDDEGKPEPFDCPPGLINALLREAVYCEDCGQPYLPIVGFQGCPWHSE